MKKDLKKKKDRKKILLIFVITLLIISLIFLIFSIIKVINYSKIIEKKEIGAYLIVSDHYGFDVNNTIFAFGMVVPGGSVTRQLIVQNKYDFPISVEVVPKEDMKKFVENQKFIVLKNQTIIKAVSAHTSFKTNYGNYTGNISIIVRRYI